MSYRAASPAPELRVVRTKLLKDLQTRAIR